MKVAGYIGVDVQSARDCPYVVLNAELKPQASGWLKDAREVRAVVLDAAKSLGTVAIGIDAPRCPLPKLRPHYWDRNKWRPRRTSESGHGRHCEVILAALKISKPQYTPPLNACPDWMLTGFKLFDALSAEDHIYEVFPSASYRLLAKDRSAVLSVCLSGFAEGPKDMLDAYVAAFTVHEYLAGKGTAVGGGDGLGVIVLPRPIHALKPKVLHWPESQDMIGA